MKNVVKCSKHFFGYFNALKTQGGQIPFPKLLELGSMPNLKHLYIGYAKSPLIEALVKNLPNLKINEGSFNIAHPDPRNLDYLWEMQCKPTQDFLFKPDM